MPRHYHAAKVRLLHLKRLPEPHHSAGTRPARAVQLRRRAVRILQHHLERVLLVDHRRFERHGDNERERRAHALAVIPADHLEAAPDHLQLVQRVGDSEVAHHQGDGRGVEDITHGDSSRRSTRRSVRRSGGPPARSASGGCGEVSCLDPAASPAVARRRPGKAARVRVVSNSVIGGRFSSEIARGQRADYVDGGDPNGEQRQRAAIPFDDSAHQQRP